MKKKILYASALLVLLGISGCKKLEDFGSTNDNPAAINEPVYSALLANVESGLGAYAAQTRPGLYGQYFSETQYTDVSLYSTPQLDFTGNYSGALNDLQVIIDGSPSNNMKVVAKILQQYIFWTITDRWGDVPYSEALQALASPNPAYDTQQDIYEGMLATLAQAVDDFDNTSAIKGDLIYGGEVESWQKAANSMRLLMALQLSNRFPNAGDYAADEFNAALDHEAGVLYTNDENMTIVYPGGNFKNPWWRVYDGRKDYAESETMTDLMDYLQDDRQNAFGGLTQDQTSGDADVTSNVGVPYGLKRADAEAFTADNTDWARILRGSFRTETAPLVIISAAQVSLARAEASYYGWTDENMYDWYYYGIELSFEQWGEEADSNYFNQAAVSLEGDSGDFEKIVTQRYIASYPDGLQAWNIWRKTGYPELSPAPGNSPIKEIPRRYTYATSEYTTNAASVAEAVDRLSGGDLASSRVWWDYID